MLSRGDIIKNGMVKHIPSADPYYYIKKCIRLFLGLNQIQLDCEDISDDLTFDEFILELQDQNEYFIKRYSRFEIISLYYQYSDNSPNITEYTYQQMLQHIYRITNKLNLSNTDRLKSMSLHFLLRFIILSEEIYQLYDFLKFLKLSTGRVNKKNLKILQELDEFIDPVILIFFESYQ